jgi:lambda family phage minor tail protein L
MTDSYISEVQKPDPSAIIQLYELELVEGTHYATGNPDSVTTTYCWHSGMTAAGAGSIVFNSKTYTPMPIEAEGFDQKSGQNDGVARPVLRVSNLLSTVSTILIEVNKITTGNDLLNAKVTRIETLAMFLDGETTANTSATSRNQVFIIDRKSLENREIVEFELSAIWDLPNFKIPARQVLPRQFPGVGAFHE